MTPEGAYQRCQAALADDDPAAAEYWLTVLHVLNDEVEDRQIAQAVRDTELFAMAAACDWWWEVE
jgi:hypothetical protein